MAQQTPPSANEVLQTAFGKAKVEKKKVFIIFHASWCGWCHKMDSALNDPACKNFFETNYIFEHLTIHESADNKNLENPGAEELFKKYAAKTEGIPFWLIYNAEGDVIADSKLPNGDNIGCPAADTEVKQFIAILKKTATLSAREEKAIFERFRKNQPVR